MKKLSGNLLKNFAVILSTSALLFASLLFSSSARAEQRPLLTLHVPEAVASGIAPLVGHVPASGTFQLGNLSATAE